MNNDYIYRSFTKAELVQRCIDLGINRVAMLAERSRLRAELAECKRDAERDAERYRWLRAVIGTAIRAIEKDMDNSLPLPMGEYEAYCAMQDGLYQIEAKGEHRPRTCHPDDNAPAPCPRRYALSECREAALAAKGETK